MTTNSTYIERFVNGLNDLNREGPKGKNAPPAVQAMWQRGPEWKSLLRAMPLEEYAQVLALVQRPLSDYNTRVAAATWDQVELCMARIAKDGKGGFVIATDPQWDRGTHTFSCGLGEHGWYIYDIQTDLFVTEKQSREQVVDALKLDALAVIGY